MPPSAALQSGTALTGEALRAYLSMRAVTSNPDALASEIAKWSPEIVLKVLAHDGGKVLPIGGYFIGAAVDALDPAVWRGAALVKLRVEINDLFSKGAIDAVEMAKLLENLGIRPAYVNQMIIVYKLRHKTGARR